MKGHRRGVALLLVLATLLLVTVAAASLMRAASTETQRRQLDADTAVAGDLLEAVEAPIQHWLAHEAGSVVLPPDVAEPRVLVRRDAWTTGGRDYEVTITAWDQAGMVPLSVARSGSPLRLAVPSALLEVVDRLDRDERTAPGLDLVAAALRPLDGVAAFPRAPAENEEIEAPPAVGALISTHGANAINVNTAPEPVLEAALRAAGRSGSLELILAAREAGETATLPQTSTRQERERRPTVQLVGTSPCWSLRIDLQSGIARRSWWAVYMQRGSEWKCVQRLAITS